MSAARSIILLGLPGIAIVLGILWYRKRNPNISDPGGSVVKRSSTTKSPNKNNTTAVGEKKLAPISVSPALPPVAEALSPISSPQVVSETPEKLSKSLPIDIPVGSPIELTDDQLDIEILKIQSQKSQEKDYSPFAARSLKLSSPEKPIEETIAEKSFKTIVSSPKSVNMAEDNTEIRPMIENSHANMDAGDSIVNGDDICTLDNSDNSQKDCETERSDWSEELCELEYQAAAASGDNVRDSAYHSPTENMSSSPQLSAYSDRHSEHSVDSGKGSSPRSELASTFEFLLPQHIVGRLIGRNGAFVHRIKALTGANIIVKKHPDNVRLKICAVEGLQTEIDAALIMIRSKFPEKKFPNITLQRVILPQAPPTPELSPECLSLLLVEGVNNDCTVSSVQNGGSVSLQQPLHPSFPSLNLLQCCMAQTYTDADNPVLPTPVIAGMVCACPLDCGWYRAQITNIIDTPQNDDKESSEDVVDQQVELRLVDYGDRIISSVSKLRQIRADLMMLPFQAVDCLLANVQPLNGATEWSAESGECLRSLTFGRLLQAQIYGFLDDTPLVHLYCCISPNQVMFINQELVARGLAEWVEAEA